MYIQRVIEGRIRERLFSRKAILLNGPRQCGKTTLLRHLADDFAGDALWLVGDDPVVRDILGDMTQQRWRNLIGNRRLVIIDEAQKIAGIGNSLKLVTDLFPEVQVIASGSSSFELTSATAESLTGRKYEFVLLPLSFREMADATSWMEERGQLENRLVFGSYPEAVLSSDSASAVVSSLAGSYLYKDVLALEMIRKSAILEKLVKALALQVGSEASVHEFAQISGSDDKTVERYLSILERAYVIFRLPAFSRNVRTELKKSRKVYFYDLGVRNAVLGDFMRPANRVGIGHLWENFLIAERVKRQVFAGERVQRFFWRTTMQQEIDYLEITEDRKMRAFEFKWNPDKKARLPPAFARAYPDATFEVVTPANYADEFL